MNTTIADVSTPVEQYRKLGLIPVPLKKKSKEPRIKTKEYLDGQVIEDELNQVDWGKGNVGIVCGKTAGIFVLDQDAPDALDDYEIPEGTPTVKTREGRYQYFFKYPSGVDRVKGEVKFLDGLDLRADGNYVVAPPSIHPETLEPYEWIVELPESLDELPECPQWLLTIIDPPQIDYGALANAIDEMPKQGDPFETQRLMVEWVRTTYGVEPDQEKLNSYIFQSLYKEFEAKEREELIVTASELENKEFAPLRWAVPGILPEGVAILAAKQKMGKSWMALGLCVAVASGGTALGTRTVEQGEALYLDLEGNQRRIQDRLRQMGEFPHGLYITNQWRGADDGGIEDLDHWLGEHPNCRLVVIDTLKKVRTRKRGGKNAYDVEYEDLEPYAPLAHKHGTTILIVHHYRKDSDTDDPYDAVSGSVGLTAAIDGVLLLQRERGAADATLYVDGRDIEEQESYALRFDQEIHNWTIVGDAAKYRMSPERRDILDLLEKHGPLGPAEIARKLDKNSSTTKTLLGKLLEEHHIDTQAGKYFVDHVGRLKYVA